MNRGIRIIGFIAAGILILFGVLFILASAYGISRLFVGLVLLALGGAIIYLLYPGGAPAGDTRLTVELPGKVDLEELHCRNCGARLEASSVVVQNNTVLIKCPYCDNVYTMSEEPKW